MPKPVKWLLIAVAALAFLIIAAMIIVPLVVDVNKYKPQIEALASKQIGRPLTLGGEITPSVFPWIGIGIQDVRLGNAPDFTEKNFVSVDEIEVRIKLLPILTGNYEIKRFVIKGAHITLIKDKTGRLNTQGMGPPKKAASPTHATPQEIPQNESGLPIKSLAADEIALKDSSVIWIDQAKGQRKEIDQINLVLRDVSLINPIQMDFKAVADGYPLSLQGTLGPLGSMPGKNPLKLDLTARILEALVVHLKGSIENAAQSPGFSMMLAVDTFSPRDLLLGLKKTLPFEPSDDSVLKKAAMQMNIEGTPENLSLSKGRFLMDDTTVTFSAQAKDLAKPDLKLSATLDKLDLDRYLPPPPKDKTSQEKTTPPPKNAPIDYSPLRKLVLDARIKAGELKIKNSRMQNIEIKISARNGIFHLDPFGVDLYQGKLAAKGKLDVRSNKPETELNLEIGGVQAGPLVTDFMKKDIIRGALNAVLELKFTGDQLDSIRKTLDGRGQLKFNDGAVVGLDLADMVRNVQTAFGLAEKPDDKPRTDFSEMVIALAINQGQAKIDGSKLNSPLLRLLADGSADLVRETLDLRITPKFVATLVGQGDDRQRSGKRPFTLHFAPSTSRFPLPSASCL